ARWSYMGDALNNAARAEMFSEAAKKLKKFLRQRERDDFRQRLERYLRLLWEPLALPARLLVTLIVVSIGSAFSPYSVHEPDGKAFFFSGLFASRLPLPVSCSR